LEHGVSLVAKKVTCNSAIGLDAKHKKILVGQCEPQSATRA